MNTQEVTIEALQDRIKYLEAHLHLALQYLRELEEDSLELSRDLEHKFLSSNSSRLTHNLVNTVELPSFLDSRTWGHHSFEVVDNHNSSDRLVARAS